VIWHNAELIAEHGLHVQLVPCGYTSVQGHAYFQTIYKRPQNHLW
jgi:hypothetical protein